MNYIIDPSWFYWFNLFESIRIVCAIGSGICFFVMAFCGANFLFSIAEEKEAITCKKFAKTALILIIIFALVFIFIPSRETLIEMQVAKFATYENAEWTVESLKSIIDYIIDAINNLK